LIITLIVKHVISPLFMSKISLRPPPPPPAPVRRTNSNNFFDLSEDEILDPSTDELGAGKLTKFIKSQRKCDATTHDSDR